MGQSVHVELFYGIDLGDIEFDFDVWNWEEEWAKRSGKPPPDVEFGFYGFIDETFGNLYIAQSQKHFSYDCFDVHMLRSHYDWDIIIENFCKVMNIPAQLPKWMVSVSYG